MFSKYVLSFCIVVLFANVLLVKAEDEAENNEDDPRSIFSNSLVKKAIKLIGEQFAGAAGNCIEEAAKECKKQIFPLKKLFRCAGHYFEENKGRCLLE